DQTGVGDLRIIVDQNLADIEDDVMDFTHFPYGLLAFVAPGIAASIAFFMTVGSASPCSSAGLDHQWPAGASIAGTSARNTNRLRAKWVKTCVTTPQLSQEPGKGAAEMSRSPSCRAVQALVGTSVMPPSSPFSGRWRRSTAPSERTAMKAAPWRSGLSAF